MRIVVIGSVLAIAGVARAQSADAEFERGVALKKAGNCAAALSAFEKSESLDPQNGTEYNIAFCQAELNKTVEAIQALRRLVKEDANPDRRKLEVALLAELEKKVGKLHIQLQLSGKVPDDLEVTLDAVDVTDRREADLEVDPGTHIVTTAAKGYQSTHVEVDVPVGAVVVPVVIAIAREVRERHVEPAPAPVSPPAEDKPQRRVATPVEPTETVTDSDHPAHHTPFVRPLVVGGSIAVGLGLISGAIAWKQFSDAQNQANMCGPDPGCLMMANQGADHAGTFGDVSTGLVVVGGAAIAVGTVLWLVHRNDGHEVAIVPAAHGTGLAVAGHF